MTRRHRSWLLVGMAAAAATTLLWQRWEQGNSGATAGLPVRSEEALQELPAGAQAGVAATLLQSEPTQPELASVPELPELSLSGSSSALELQAVPVPMQESTGAELREVPGGHDPRPGPLSELKQVPMTAQSTTARYELTEIR